MLKKIWQSFTRWFRKLFGRGTHKSLNRVPATELPPLDDTDREYLFMQLLEGVAHGWQQPRAIGFFNKIRQRVRKSEWLEWLDKFGNNLLAAPVPNYELAGRMVQLGQLDCGEIGDLAGDYGARLLERQVAEFNGDLLPIMEFSSLDSDPPFDLSYSQDRQFDDIPLELLAERESIADSPSRSLQARSPEADPASETREITLEEFSAMLHKDPSLVAELAEQFGIETTDPQVIVNAVVAQMQQQVQQISGDLNPAANELTPPQTPPAAPPEIPTPPPEITAPPPAPPEIPVPEPTPPSTPAPEARTPRLPIDDLNGKQLPPPPPPFPKLEYNKPEDPWSSNLLENSEETLPKPANTPDRRGV
jgi:hypothetical protein